MSRKLRPLAALAMVALTGAGCSNGSAEKGNTGTGSSTGSSGGNENATIGDRTVKFAECMRENGVKDFPDPNASGDQEFVDAIKRGSSRDPAAWKRAIGACRDLQPPGLLGGKASPQEMRARLKFAQCMRDNGVKDFPDPTKDGPLIDTTRIPSAAGRGARNIPGFQATMEKCRDVMADALGGR
jgi:hypothetical protein